MPCCLQKAITVNIIDLSFNDVIKLNAMSVKYGRRRRGVRKNGQGHNGDISVLRRLLRMGRKQLMSVMAFLSYWFCLTVFMKTADLNGVA